MPAALSTEPRSCYRTEKILKGIWREKEMEIATQSGKKNYKPDYIPKTTIFKTIKVANAFQILLTKF